ncbi:polyamine ABC transporter substrate-binding protein [Mesorhizobium sp. LNHC229A00]|uniref:polyamine ABC transporter substrate-binding protein n=1 Tax=Mesorhizobium sp. LNHC229A00 TaxID=1287240 RepID=UPI0003CE7409|nr:polyamine ABC transporter substrate-binding protein [Mesorhizobium sp. LNHC229A00]ESY93714.1 putrescine/spermidine ABC transporter substrate-binding protein [Mesorhizobium sp. LNHC229A00]
MRSLALLAASMLCLSAASLCGAAAAEDKIVNIFFWYDYVPADTITEFEKQTGIKVVYDTFDSVDMLTTKALTGGSGYDIIMPGAALVGQYAEAGAIQKLDKAKIPNAGGLNPDIMAFLARQDPGNVYALPYAYGTTGIMYNPAKVAARMKDAPVDSLDMIFKPEIAAKFQDCGIAMVDSPEGVMSVALNYLGFDPFSTDEAELRKAGALLAAIKPYIRHLKSGSIMSELAAGDLCLALGWSGDAIGANAKAADSKNGVDVRYSVPREGTEIFFDVMTVPVDAPHPENAHALMNFLMAPQVSVRFTNATLYPNAVQAATPLVDETVRDNPNIYFSKDMLKRLFAAQPRDPKSLRLVTRLWTSFVTGTN